MASSLLRLLALSTIAIIGASYGPAPVTAVSVESHHFVRNEHAARHHGILAKRQQNSSTRKRCKARSSSLAASSVTPAATSAAETSKAAAAPTSTRAAQQQQPQSSPAPAAPKTTKAASPSPSPSPQPSNNNNAPSGGGKVGIAYAGDVNVARFVRDSSQVKFVYNWSPHIPSFMDQLRGGIQFVPMLWGQKQGSVFRQGIRANQQDFVLGMNEPNQDGQANISPEYGAQLWKEYIQPLKAQGYTLVSPAPTNAPSGLTWLQRFIAACDGCNVDRIATHWYGIDPENFIQHIQNYANVFGRKVWITEYACQDFSGRNQQCSTDQIFSFMRRTKGFMDGANFVEMYAYFGVLNNMGNVNWGNRLINDDGSPNALGRIYLGLA